MPGTENSPISKEEEAQRWESSTLLESMMDGL